MGVGDRDVGFLKSIFYMYYSTLGPTHCYCHYHYVLHAPRRTYKTKYNLIGVVGYKFT